MISVDVVVVLPVVGLFYFKRIWQYFVDIVFMADEIAVRIGGLGKKYVIGGLRNNMMHFGMPL
ncbi:MAG: hypothetical protein STSR0009_12910 [Methanoregula sp.]